MFAALRVDVGVGGGGVDAADAGAPVERRIAREAAPVYSRNSHGT